MVNAKDTTPALIPFTFQQHTLSVITDDDGQPWWIAADVCAALELGNVSQALSRLDADEKNTIILNDGSPGNPAALIVNESGLYSLILGSRKKVAREFKRWVTHDVLPTLRKTGAYALASPADPVERYPELRAIRELLVATAEARDEATLARQEAQAADARSMRAETKADMALDEAHRMTVEEFILKNGLYRQFPPPDYLRITNWLKDFCQQYGLSFPKAPVYGKPWDGENSYPLQALAAWLRYEQKRPRQVALVPRQEA